MRIKRGRFTLWEYGVESKTGLPKLSLQIQHEDGTDNIALDSTDVYHLESLLREWTLLPEE